LANDLGVSPRFVKPAHDDDVVGGTSHES
jgi:hypothetical protein